MTCRNLHIQNRTGLKLLAALALRLCIRCIQSTCEPQSVASCCVLLHDTTFCLHGSSNQYIYRFAECIPSECCQLQCRCIPLERCSLQNWSWYSIALHQVQVRMYHIAWLSTHPVVVHVVCVVYNMVLHDASLLYSITLRSISKNHFYRCHRHLQLSTASGRYSTTPRRIIVDVHLKKCLPHVMN